jgi:plastocyanin
MEENTQEQPAAKGSNMMMILVAVVVLVLLGGGAYYFMSQKSAAPMQKTEENTESMQESKNEMTPKAMETSQAPSQAAATSPSAAMPSGAMQSGKVVEVTVKGQNYSFAPNVINVKKGDTVKVTFMNTGGFHDFVVDEFNAKTKTIKDGESDTVQFVADKAGTFEFYCSVGQHRQMGMKGNLIVQ